MEAVTVADDLWMFLKILLVILVACFVVCVGAVAFFSVASVVVPFSLLVLSVL